MLYPQSRLLYLLAILADLLLIQGALLFGGLWDRSELQASLVLAAILLLVWFGVSLRTNLYFLSPSVRIGAELRALLESWIASLAIVSVICIILYGNLRFEALETLVAGAAGLVTARLIWRALRYLLPEHDMGWNRLLLVGRAESVTQLLGNSQIGDSSRVSGYVPFPGDEVLQDTGLPRLGSLQDLPKVIADNHIASLVVCPSERVLTRDVEHVIALCDQAGMPLHFVPSFLSTLHLRGSLDTSSGTPTLSFQSAHPVSLQAAIKRGVDIAVGLFGLILTLPIMTICAAAIWFEERGSIFYRQTRVGRNGRSFPCYKFRTMHKDADRRKHDFLHANEQDGPAFKMRNDPRITSVGRILRRYSLDELPQFWNVLVGDMSLVGPRPPVPSEVQQYDWWQRRRISVRPGMTGIWQVWGRNKVSFTRWIEMDLYYIDNWSLWLDIKLLLRTFGTVFRGSGV